MQPADVFVIVATVLAWTTLIPQILQMVRTNDIEGVSVTWPFIGLVSNAVWTAYLASQGLYAAMPSTAVMVVFYVVVIRLLARGGASLRSSAVRGTAWAALLGGVGVVWGWSGVGLALGWSYGVQMAPPVAAAYRSHDPTGVSVGSWWLITVEAVLWGVYGVLVGDVPIVVFGATGTVAGGLILARVVPARRRRQRESLPPIASSDGRL